MESNIISVGHKLDQTGKKIVGGITSIEKTTKEYMITYETGETGKLNILNNHVFKYYMSPTGVFPDYPTPHHPDETAKINSKKVSDYDIQTFQKSELKEHHKTYVIDAHKIHIIFEKETGLMSVVDKRWGKEVLKEIMPLSYQGKQAKQALHQHKDEHFFGGGMQNGRFTHKGEEIKIVNSNNWVDGGVTSPCPFYWSSNGYGILRNTWQSGVYDYGKTLPNVVTTTHKGEDFDAFFFINTLPKDILNDYFELTGESIFMPEYAFYEAHLNAFNRDYWVKVTADTPRAVLFEDGFYYRSYQPSEIGDKHGILESLNGEKNNYQFSARAMVDRYKRHDVPLGWFIPNDGYGSGYGQTDSLEGDIQNLKDFADYARDKGVEVALWTESQLEPKDPSNPKKGERDLAMEVSEAGVVALKCDVAWIGYGYSFGLNAVENATNIFKKNSALARSFIIMVDGWAGTQRYSGIWTGDQSGGEWEYIRFHIPTYIGSGLSGQPIVGSDMDGIYAGRSREVNIRDFQWKTFTPLQLNMDGWGNLQKTPFSFDDEATSINRSYLKLKSMMMPYNYTIGHEAVQGLPLIRAMFLEFPDETPAYTKDSQYQFMWGPSVLVAPIYNPAGLMDASLRDGIYLPDPAQIWIDFFTGEKYQGGKIYNNIRTPLWKLPVFIRDGAIIPMVNPNNNPYDIKRDNRTFTIYPNNKTTFDVFEDDGISSRYKDGHFATTNIVVHGPPSNTKGHLLINIHKTNGSYQTMAKERTTVLQIMASKDVKHVKAAVEGANIEITKANSEEEFDANDNVFYFKEDFAINPYLKEEGTKQKFLLIKIEKIDVTEKEIHIKINDYANEDKVFGADSKLDEKLKPPSHLSIIKEAEPTSLTLLWQPEDDAIYYEIERDGTIFTNINGSSFAFHDFKYETLHLFKIRSIGEQGFSEWSEVISAMAKEDPYKYTVKGVKASCSLPCQPGEEIKKLTDGDLSSMWHTCWNMPNEADPKTNKCIKVVFDLGDIYEIEKVEYHPRSNVGNGTILKLQYRYTIDHENWSAFSEPIVWNKDKKVKTIELNGIKMKFMEWKILDSISGFAAGRQVFFYKTNK